MRTASSRSITVGSKRAAGKLKRQLERDSAIWRRKAESMTVPVIRSDRLQRRHSRSTPPLKSHGGRLSVAGYAATWLPAKALSERGRSVDELVLRRYIIPGFQCPIEAVTHADVRAIMRTMEQDKSGATLAKIRTVGSSICNDPIEDGVAAVNPGAVSGSRSTLPRRTSGLTRVSL